MAGLQPLILWKDRKCPVPVGTGTSRRATLPLCVEAEALRAVLVSDVCASTNADHENGQLPSSCGNSFVLRSFEAKLHFILVVLLLPSPRPAPAFTCPRVPPAGDKEQVRLPMCTCADPGVPSRGCCKGADHSL